MTCDEATQICDKRQYKEATFWEKVKLQFHILMCKNCRHYSQQNAILTKVCNKHGKAKDAVCLTSEEKTKLEKTLFDK